MIRARSKTLSTCQPRRLASSSTWRPSASGAILLPWPRAVRRGTTMPAGRCPCRRWRRAASGSRRSAGTRRARRRQVLDRVLRAATSTSSQRAVISVQSSRPPRRWPRLLDRTAARTRCTTCRGVAPRQMRVGGAVDRRPVDVPFTGGSVEAERVRPPFLDALVDRVEELAGADVRGDGCSGAHGRRT